MITTERNVQGVSEYGGNWSVKQKPATEHYKFVQNHQCEYFPCHRVEDKTRFNCLFCFCPLYMLKGGCGGDFTYTKKGVKDCGGCLIPHCDGGYDHVMGKMKQVVKIGSERSTGAGKKL